ncbi:uncharacterized protein LOC110029078 [Phalaenopsis equestris]|uniref:uncharacterized protein LOC110029078 n=1 Tax=Phalaenopsis equestris TaxID=78828 RepID=UPI0009E654F5|nr:uncharacterized protein LOC110029078 [Phalaenopsis equestris]
MECNKEDAIRAKDIAEKKMQIRDFAGAKKLLLMALHLCPDIENASHMLTVCEVHCSAEKLVNAQTDHYGVLQVESSADEALIRKQYRRLALLLHPDKNRFAGAEAAFKLVGEAYKVLSDQASRQVYDSKRSVRMRTVSSWKPSQHFKHASSNAGAPNYSSVNQPGGIKQHNKQSPLDFLASHYFWSVCIYCYYFLCIPRALLNREVECHKCLKKFCAYEVRHQNVPPFGSGSGFVWEYTGFHQTDVPTQYFHTHGSQTHFGNSSGARVHENVVRPPTVSKPSKSVTATKHGRCATDKEDKAESGGIGDELKPENGKTGQKSAMSSLHGACQRRNRTTNDNDNIKEVRPTDVEDGSTSGRYPRRSTRCKKNVIYKEEEIEDDFECPKRLRKFGSYSTKNRRISSPEVVTNGVKKKTNEIPASEDEIMDEQIGADHCEDNLPRGSGLEKRMMPESKEAVCKKRTSSQANSAADSRSRTQVDFSFSYADPEFYDFDMDRDQSKFAVNQIWAVYDDDDGMPRYYALIQKVFAPGFKLQYTWLEYNPMSSAEKAWVKAGLPTACGNFKHGKVCSTKCQLMFSHLICVEKGGGSTYNIYPKKGEVWALFNDWDMQWSSTEENPRTYSYEFVEVVSDYASGQDFIVSHLVKVRGYLYLFARAQDKGVTVIPTGQLLKFSHCIPYCRVSVEREGIPRDSFELDPAALSDSAVSNADAGGVHAAEVLDVKSGDPCQRPVADKDKLVVNLIRSLRPSQHVIETAGRKTRNHDFSNLDRDIKDSSSNGQESDNLEFFNFQKDRAEEKFKQGQIWGLYSDLDEYPNYYAWVSSASWETTGLTVKWLEFSPQTKEEKLWSKNGLPVSCGRFKLTSKVAQYDLTHAFSHLVHAQPLRKNNFFEIYPNSGEVWAVFSNWSLKWISTEFRQVADYSVVEVIERDKCVIKVITLTKVKGYKYVFMPKMRSVADMEIPIDECLRFSHQIPAFRLTDQESGKLKDCWVLDPDSIPKNLLTIKPRLPLNLIHAN